MPPDGLATQGARVSAGVALTQFLWCKFYIPSGKELILFSHHNAEIYLSILSPLQICTLSSLLPRHIRFKLHINSLVQDSGISIVQKMEIPQSCTKPLIYFRRSTRLKTSLCCSSSLFKPGKTIYTVQIKATNCTNVARGAVTMSLQAVMSIKGCRIKKGTTKLDKNFHFWCSVSVSCMVWIVKHRPCQIGSKPCKTTVQGLSARLR